MKIYNRVTIDMTTGCVLDEDSFEYAGPLALCGGDDPGDTGTGAGQDGMGGGAAFSGYDSGVTAGGAPTGDIGMSVDDGGYGMSMAGDYSSAEAGIAGDAMANDASGGFGTDSYTAGLEAFYGRDPVTMHQSLPATEQSQEWAQQQAMGYDTWGRAPQDPDFGLSPGNLDFELGTLGKYASQAGMGILGYLGVPTAPLGIMSSAVQGDVPGVLGGWGAVIGGVAGGPLGAVAGYGIGQGLGNWASSTPGAVGGTGTTGGPQGADGIGTGSGGGMQTMPYNRTNKVGPSLMPNDPSVKTPMTPTLAGQTPSYYDIKQPRPMLPNTAKFESEYKSKWNFDDIWNKNKI